MKISNLSALIKYIPVLCTRAFIQSYFAKNYLKQIFKNHHSSKQIDEILYKTTFVSILITILVLEYSRLIDIKITNEIRKKLILTAAIAILEDSIIDETENPTHINKLFTSVSNFQPSSELETILRDIYLRLLEQYSTEEFKSKAAELLSKSHKAQIESIEQTSSDITVDQIKLITYHKGLAIPTFIFPMNPVMKNDEIDLLQKLGTWLQLNDDYSDRITDKIEGIKTIFTHEESKNDGKIFMDEIMEGVFQEIKQFRYMPQKAKNFIFGIQVQTICYRNYYQLLSGRFSRLEGICKRNMFASMIVFSIASVLSIPEMLRIKF